MSFLRVIEFDILGEQWRVECASDWVGVATVISPRGQLFIPAKLVKALIDLDADSVPPRPR